MNNDQSWRTRTLKSQVTALREVPISHYSAVSQQSPREPWLRQSRTGAERPSDTDHDGDKHGPAEDARKNELISSANSRQADKVWGGRPSRPFPAEC